MAWSRQAGGWINVVERSACPVFVIGCHRSGTNLLYDVLLSAGGFAIYRGYLPIYKMLIPRFGVLDKRRNRERLMKTWLRSKGFRRSNLDAGLLTERVLRDCRSGGDFISIIMDDISRQQGAIRWAVYDPDNVHYVRQIKRDIPKALFVHIIRDGRDIALSLSKMGGFRPFPWDRSARGLLPTALFWEWMVRKGRKYGREIPRDYFELHYEDLVCDPRRTLASLSEFLQHDLDYDRIQRTHLGRVGESNSTFKGEPESRVNPVNRWKERLSPEEIAAIEGLVGDCLDSTGYGLTTARSERMIEIRQKLMRSTYLNFLEVKQWLKINTPLGRFADLAALELADSSLQADAAP
jgi:hypothetical protein